MLRINDFVLYMPMRNNLTDFSLNGYTATNNGATLTTGRDGSSNSAYSFNGTTNYITLPNACQQAIATALSSSGCLVYTILANNGNTGGIVDAWYNTAQNSWLAQKGNDGKLYFALYDGATSKGLNNGLNYSTSVWYFVVNNMSSATAFEAFLNISTTSSSTFTSGIKTNSTGLINIGRRGDVGQYFNGKIANVMALNKPLSSLEQQFINKFGNMKRIA